METPPDHPLRSEETDDAIRVDAVEQLEADESSAEREPPSDEDYVPV
jgi:hypothetical protein